MKTKAIFFDKDGTLLDFNALWGPRDESVVRAIARETKAEEGVGDALQALGITDGKAAIDSLILWAPYDILGATIWEALSHHGCTATKEQVIQMTYGFYKEFSHLGEVKPTYPSLRSDLRALKNAGLKFVLVTTDISALARQCLEELGIDDLFDAIYASDGKLPSKPNPACISDYLEKTGFSGDEVVMVGDAITDMEFAANGGIRSIGIASAPGSREVLLGYTDTVIPDISQLQQNLR